MNTRRDFVRQATFASLALPFAGAELFSRTPVALSEKPLRVALMGLGGYAARVAKAMQHCKRARLAGIISGTPDKIRTWQQEYQLPDQNCYNYENFDKIRDNKEIDAVYVITPNALHHDQVIRAARAGKHVICEKPMAINVKQGEEMVAACQKAGVKLLVGYRLHFEPATLEVIRMRNAGDFGAIRFFQGLCGFRIGDPNQWRLNKELAGGGALYDIGIYAINGCRYMMGDEPVYVTAQETKTDPLKFKEGVDETIMFQFGFKSGAVASCLSSYNMNNLDKFFLNGDKGFAELHPATGYGPIRGRTHKGNIDPTTEMQQTLQMDEMAAVILDDKKPAVPVDGMEGVRDLRIIEAIYKAAASGEKVAL